MSQSAIESSALDLIEFAANATDRALVASTSGNASLRVDDERMLITASGAELGRLTPKHLTSIRLVDGRRIRGPEPSLESSLHRGAYGVRRTVGAVLHCQSPAATILACEDDAPSDLNFIPEFPAYVRAHARVAYAAPGSDELAHIVARALEDPEVTVVQMQNHGQIVVGRSWAAVLRRAVFFELACSIAVHGKRPQTLSSEDVSRLRDYGSDF